MPEPQSHTNLPYGRQTISEADIAAVEEVLRSPNLTQGPTVQLFEQAVAAKVGACFGVAVNSATSALHIGCLALGLARRSPLDLADHVCGLLPTAAAIAALQSTLSTSIPRRA